MDAAIDRTLPADFCRFERSDVETSLPARLDHIVARYPSQVAIEDGDIKVTYAELDRESNRVAHRLLEELGGDPEPIALLYEQGAAFHIAQFGVLKSGKFYACLDPELRAEKRSGLLADLGARAILCSATMAPLAREASRRFSPDAGDQHRGSVTIERCNTTQRRSRARPSCVCHLYIWLDGSTRRRGDVASKHDALHDESDEQHAHPSGRPLLTSLPTVFGRNGGRDVCRFAERRDATAYPRQDARPPTSRTLAPRAQGHRFRRCADPIPARRRQRRRQRPAFRTCAWFGYQGTGS